MKITDARANVFPNQMNDKDMSSLLTAITKNYATPFYLYDYEILKSTYYNLRSIFPSQVDIFYSMKANPNLSICTELRRLGACAEVCSLFELEAAIKSGFLANNIIFVGPAKTREELLACIKFKIYAIVCESHHEFNLIEKLAKELQVVVPVALRINPNFILKTAALKMGGQASQFGIDEELFFSDPNFFFKQPLIKIIGIHVYNGTRLLNAHAIIENISNIFHLFARISDLMNLRFEMLDIGGGLGVPYFENEHELDLDLLKALLAPIVDQFVRSYPSTRIILESGRFLVAQCGVFVSNILDKKISKQRQFLVTDGGTNCHMAAIGVGSLFKRNFPISLSKASHRGMENEYCYDIVGPLCTPGDLIGKNVVLPNAEIGDWIVVHCSGAYGPTASPTMFLSHGFPAEILLKNNQVHLIRSSQKLEDFFFNQFIVDESFL
jgi:diaminopimelate decarboxylase